MEYRGWECYTVSKLFVKNKTKCDGISNAGPITSENNA